MSAINFLPEESPLQDIAKKYKERGYTVIIDPPSKQLPKFLTKFNPDMIAQRQDESVVIQVKSAGKKRGTNYWRELSSVLQNHPGWRLEVVVGGQSKRTPSQNLKKEQIKERLQEGQELAQQKLFAASLLITWSAVEAAMRLASKNQDIDLPNLLPATVISRLYSDGLLSRDEYDFLVNCMSLCNSVAHGFQNGEIKASTINRLQRIASQFLQ